MKLSRATFFVSLALLLAACTASGPVPKGVKVGKPYVVDGQTYYPSFDPTYDKIGDASWYGPGFHGKYTANGEVFNQNDLTAAHPTLPMPSVVRVTNLENGKSAIIRINDRGPFKKNRIIDLSKASAQKLGVHSIHRVRVQFLRDETERYMASVQDNKPLSMAAFNNEVEDAKEESLVASTAPASQIVESTVVETQPGQTVGSAAPVQSVSRGDIEQQVAQRRSPFIRSAMADDEVVSSGGSAAETPSAPQITEVTDYETQGTIQSKPVEFLHTTEPKTPTQPEPAPKAAMAEEKPASKTKKMAQASPSSGGNYMIQAGSFSLEANAKKLGSMLRNVTNLESKVIVEKVDMSGRQWWRVRAGPFGNKDDADSALSAARAHGAPEARIVQQ